MTTPSFRRISFVTLLTLLLVFPSCQSSKNFYTLPTYSSQGKLQAVIEIPAGTNHKYEYEPQKNQFEIDKIDGKARVVKYLAYPGNYGFIPSTLMDPSQGGDGDALDVLIISEYVPIGTVLEIIPIATLRLLDGGEIDDKIIAIPAQTKLQTLVFENPDDFGKHPAAAQIRDWFLHYKGPGHMEFKGWLNQEKTTTDIKRWMK